MQAENEFWVYGHKRLQGLFPIVYLNKGRNNLWAKSEGGVKEPLQANSVAQVILRITVYSHSITV